MSNRVILPPLSELEAGLILNSLSLVAAIVAGDDDVAGNIVPHAALLALEMGGNGLADLVGTIADLCERAFPLRAVVHSGTIKLPGNNNYVPPTKPTNGGLVS